MNKIKILFSSVLLLAIQFASVAQCAMCRTQVVNNVSHGETTFAAGLNTGILYLFFTPYVLIAVLIYLWFKYSKKNAQNKSLASRIGRQMS